MTARPALILLVAALAVAAPLEATVPSLDVHLEPEAITVGDRVTATLTLTAPGERVDGQPRFPDWQGAWGEAEVLEAGPVERVGGSAASAETVTWRQRLVLTSFRTGEVPLPRRTVTLPLRTDRAPDRAADRGDEPAQLRTPADLALSVRSVLPPGTDPGEAEPAPAAPPQPLPAGSRFWWTLATAALLAVATLATAVARRPRTVARPARRAAPLEELLESLRGLSVEASAELGHEELSLALRRYLGRSLDFAAVESTTTEIRSHLRRRGVPSELTARVGEVLRACDGVKFACERADRTALARRLDLVREIARELACRLHAAAGYREPAAPAPRPWGRP
jgi:hypothetical protein